MRLPTFALVALALVACAETHAADDAGATDTRSDPIDAAAEGDAGCVLPPEVQAFETAQSDAVCRRSIACLSEGMPINVTLLSPFAMCGTAYAEDPVQLCDDLTSGRRSFDATAAARCVAAMAELATRSCSLAIDPDLPGEERLRLCLGWASSAIVFPLECVDVYVRNTIDCWPDQRCGPGMTCVAGERCGATCQRAAEGEDCTVLRCAPGLWCHADGRCSSDCVSDTQCATGAYCIASRCTTPDSLPTVGEACLVTMSREICDGRDTFCDRTHVCRAAAALGEACEWWGDTDVCAYGECDGSVCTRSTFCAADAGWDPFFGCDPERPYCSFTHDCTDRREEAGCAQGLCEVDTCPEGLLCDLRGLGSGDVAPCRPEVALGAVCDGTVVCARGSVCHRARCVPLVGIGERCDAEAVCAPHARCSEGVCIDSFGTPHPQRPIGSDCAIDADCAEGRCSAGRCAWESPGGPCTSDGQCPRGCAEGACADYHWVDDGGSCDDESALCRPELRCIGTTTLLDGGFYPHRICRGPC